MNYLSVENLSKSYGVKMLFDTLSFGLNKGDKTALIANNGTGKSSMLKVIAGQDAAETGEVVIRKGIRVGYLSQEPKFDKNKTINELLKGANSKVLKIVRAYEQVEQKMAENYNESVQKEFDIASEKMESANAWDYEDRMKQILSKFNITNLNQKVAMLSGGQVKRLSLALVLLDSPEVLILDEPTNHLDVEMIEWLEKYLMQTNITLLMVTHDRYFLDRVCNHILELQDGNLYHHKGNYSHFLEKRDEREEVYDIEIEKAKKLYKKELDWMRKSPSARTTKSKSRINSFYDVKKVAHTKRNKQELTLDVKMNRVGGKVLEMKKVYKSYNGLEILKGFDYTFNKGERIGIIGKNGVGKSTFLNIITGKEQPDSGKINTGDTIVYGYYTQGGIKVADDKRVIDVLKDVAEVIVMADGSKVSASQFLEHFMFTPDMQYGHVNKLSGGERRRLYLMMVLIQNPNFLILDEPTNDLDLLTLQKLEEFLMNYAGCLILVSHDRYFMDKLVDHLFVFESNGVITDHYCSYTEYREKQNALPKAKTVKPKKEVVKKEEPATVTRKMSYNEKREFGLLEVDIDRLEKEKKRLEVELTTCEDADEMTKKSVRFAEVVDLLDEKSMRWLELSEMES
jgi:ATP-binding cassette subfamily F protein uup